MFFFGVKGGSGGVYEEIVSPVAPVMDTAEPVVSCLLATSLPPPPSHPFFSHTHSKMSVINLRLCMVCVLQAASCEHLLWQ